MPLDEPVQPQPSTDEKTSVSTPPVAASKSPAASTEKQNKAAKFIIAATKDPLHVRLRPTTLSAVLGQETAVTLLSKQIAAPDRAHLYLLSGPAGTGKTTLGRILASELDCTHPLEIDGPSHSGIDDMRELREYVQYQGLDGKPKVVIIDECHALSKAAWQAALKVMEEPPAHVYFVLCTTEQSKIPTAIKTRAFDVQLKHIAMDVLLGYGEKVILQEQLIIPENGIRYIAAQADGSMRQMLVDLNRVNGAVNLAAVQKIMESPLESEDDEVVQIGRAIVSGRINFEMARKNLGRARAEGKKPEAIRIQLAEYLSAVVLNSEEKPRLTILDFLGLFSQPVPDAGGWAALLWGLHSVLGQKP